MSADHVFYSDSDVRFEVDLDPLAPSLHVHHDTDQVRHFLSRKHLQQLADEINKALQTPQPETVHE